MADRSYLTPVRLTDRNGWLRTVYRRLARNPVGDGMATVPAPQVATAAADGRLPSVRRRPKAELRELSWGNALLRRPGGVEACSFALDLRDARVVHPHAMYWLLYDGANVRGPGHLLDTLRIAQRLGGTVDEAAKLGDLSSAVAGYRQDQMGPAEITTEHELDVAVAVVSFILRLIDADAPLGTIAVTSTRDPMRGTKKIAHRELDHRLRERPEDAKCIADFAIAHGPIRDHGDMLRLVAWLDEGVNQNLGGGWL